MTLINSEYGKRGGSEMLQVIKRDGTKVPFDKHKIAVAIEKAEHSSTGLYESGLAERIADEIEAYAIKLQKDMTIYAIEDQVYYKLIEYHKHELLQDYDTQSTYSIIILQQLVPTKVIKRYKLSNVAKTRLTKMSSVCWIVVMLVFLMKILIKMLPLYLHNAI